MRRVLGGHSTNATTRPRSAVEPGVKPWQIQQAADAVRIYRYQYRRATNDAK
ncbi:MAG: hypothetical protein HYU36_11010 [Planctomycetes bacterium]|nr:hypothetical protein [Planctomycetota bacterium]